MLHASCSSSCYFLSFRGQQGRGEAQGEGRGAEQPQHSPQGTHGAASRGWEPLAQGDFRGFCSSWMMFVGYFTLGSSSFGIHTCSTQGTCAGGMGSASAGSCGVEGVQHNFSLAQQRYCFIFQTLKTGKDVKLAAPKNTSPSPLSGRVFTSRLHHD